MFLTWCEAAFFLAQVDEHSGAEWFGGPTLELLNFWMGVDGGVTWGPSWLESRRIGVSLHGSHNKIIDMMIWWYDMIWYDLMEDESWFIDPFTLMRKSMEICHEAQPLPDAARSLSKEFSRWLVTSWTSKRRGVEHAFHFDWHPNIVQKVTSCTDQDGPTCGIEWCFVMESWYIIRICIPRLCNMSIYNLYAFVTLLYQCKKIDSPQRIMYISITIYVHYLYTPNYLRLFWIAKATPSSLHFIQGRSGFKRYNLQ